MVTLLVAVMVGLAAGVLSGLFGIGGGVVIVPALVLLLGFSQKTATGTSLTALLLPVGALAVWSYAQDGHVDVKVGLGLALGIFIGALVGARVALGTSDVTLRRGFAVVLVLLAVRLALVRS
jgi:uncharacterized membrane protein YfcA